MLLSLVDRAGDGIASALAAAGIAAGDVDFYASHQCMAWFSPVTAEHAGLVNSKWLVTFPMFGNLSNVNVPLILAIGEREHMFRDGSIVVAFSGGIGETWSGLVLRWGR
jgi:3-oxoacyl-[acyl-carrier-protein] synthase-3